MKVVIVCLVLFLFPATISAQHVGYSGGLDVGLAGPLSSDGDDLHETGIGIGSLNLVGLNIEMENVSATIEVGVPIPAGFTAQSPIGLYLHPFGSTRTRPLFVAKIRPIYFNLAPSGDPQKPKKLYGGYGEVGVGYQFAFWKEQLGIRATLGYVGGTFREYGGSQWLGYHHGGVLNLSFVTLGF